MDFNSFINNLRAGMQGIGEGAKQAMTSLGKGVIDVDTAVAAPFQTLGNNIGQIFNQAGQNLGQAAQPTVQLTAAPVQVAQPSIQAAAATPVNVDPTQTYYSRNPAIDTFVNTLRFVTNPIRGITGWTPLDIVADTASDALYTDFGTKLPVQTNTTEEKKTTETTKPDQTETTNSTPANLASADDYITYTYKPGDTFGQVILDLGLGTTNGLWGSNGDVDYYTRQLIEQGALNNYGNIPIGTTIKLRRRK